MADGKMYKTKLCVMNQRGRCLKPHCNFAHGDAELRRPFNGRQEFRGGRDLRERLGRTRSPPHYSPGRRDAKERHTSHGDSHHFLGERIDRNTRTGKQVYGHDDFSGRTSAGSEGQIKDRRLLLDEQLREKHSEIKLLKNDYQKLELREKHSEIKLLKNDYQKLEIYLEDKVKEANALTFKMHELEMQLSKEKDEGKRVTTKIKKFIKAHNRHFRLQDEMKRSEAQLRKLGEQLDLDVGRENEDVVTGGVANPFYEGQPNASPSRKRSRLSLEAPDASKEVKESGKIRAENHSRRSRNHEHLSNSKKPEANGDTYRSHRPSAYNEKSIRSSNLPADMVSADKQDKLELDLTSETPHLLEPSPLTSQNADLQIKGDDEEKLDIDRADEETVDVDIV